MSDIRFCAYEYQHHSIEVLTQHWRVAEELGFDIVWNCDTMVEPDRDHHVMYDGPTTLALMSAATSKIRIGTLVSSLYFRHPVTLAKASMTLDHASHGRLEIALGVGDPSAGAAAIGNAWTPGEQVARFREFVELTSLLLCQPETTYNGTYYQCTGAQTIPLTVQRPRPPITIAAHGPRMLEIAATFADGWSSWGGYEVATEDDFYRVTRDRVARFDELCAGRNRDPRSIRHSLVCFPPLTPWESVEYFQDMVGRFVELGIDEFVLYWPTSWRDVPDEEDVFAQVATEIIPMIRSRK